MKVLLMIGWVTLMGGLFLGANHTVETPSLPVFNANVVELKSSKGVWLRDGKPFTGRLISTSPAGDTIAVSNFKAGLEEGEWKTFYERAKPRTVRFYSRGKKVGSLMEWHETGQLSVKANFVDGEYDGLLQEWDADGHLLKALNYKQGHEVGQQRAWYPSGKVRSNYTVVNGRRFGLLGTKNCINVSDSIGLSL